jgi:hypothetical protein
MLSKHDRIYRAGLFAIPTVNATQEIDLINLGIPFSFGNRIVGIILCGHNMNTTHRTVDGA